MPALDTELLRRYVDDLADIIGEVSEEERASDREQLTQVLSLLREAHKELEMILRGGGA